MISTKNAALVAATVGYCLAGPAFAQTLAVGDREEHDLVLAGASGEVETLIEKVRVATERFADVAAAEAEGYGPIPCVSGSGGGAMGVHYVNPSYLAEDDNVLDLTKPEAVLYEPQPDGSLVLVGVEYVTFEGPAALEGHLLHYHGSPNRYGLEPYYELHVWAHRENPAGPFVGMNANVSCEFAAG